MPRRPAVITQADVSRTIRAARQGGAAEVEIRPDGTILVRLGDQPAKPTPEPRRKERQIVL
jgi:hypothetical protein